MIVLCAGLAIAGDLPASDGVPHAVGRAPTDGPPQALHGPTWTATGPPIDADVAGQRLQLSWTDDGATEVAFLELCADGTATWDLGVRASLTMGQTAAPSAGRWSVSLSRLELRDRHARRSFSLTRDADGRMLLDGEAWTMTVPTGCPDGDQPSDENLSR